MTLSPLSAGRDKAPGPRLISLATAWPPHVIDQDTAAIVAAEMFDRRLTSLDLRTVFANTGIRLRRTARPLQWYLEPRGWAERNAAYLEAAETLYLDAAAAALASAGVAAHQIGTVVTVSSSGIATPSLDARLHSALGFDPDVRRLPVFGLGCAGGVSGLSLAGRLAGADPGRPVLLVVVELSSLAYRPDDRSRASLIATSLFGDGAAAAVVVADEGAGGRAMGAQAEHLWPDTLDMMGWRADTSGLGVILAPRLPNFVVEQLPAVAERFLAEAGLTRGDIDRFVCHPGGTKVLQALEMALGLGDGALDHEREVLADFGNMSAPTALFVLERVLKGGQHPGRLVLSAMGPGFTAAFLALGPDRG